MKQPDTLNDVRIFHETFGHPVEPKPIIPNKKRCDLRVSLIQEELNELKEAIEKYDLVEVADALCDIQYVLSGTILEFGLAEKFNELFANVQASNMSKACKTEEEAKATVEHYLNNKATPCYYEKKGDLYLVYRTADNKTIKSINYTPTELSKILDL